MTAEQWSSDIEVVMARHTVARALYVAPLLVGLFTVVNGWTGAWSATLGVAVVVANFLLAGAILSIFARVSLQAYHAAALFGFFLRLLLFGGAVYLIAVLVEVDRIAFGVSAVVSYLALLVLEAVAVSKGKERELTWTR